MRKKKPAYPDLDKYYKTIEKLQLELYEDYRIGDCPLVNASPDYSILVYALTRAQQRELKGRFVRAGFNPEAPSPTLKPNYGGFPVTIKYMGRPRPARG